MTSPLSQRVTALAPSATIAVAEKARALREKGVNVVAFGAGEPDFPTPPAITQAAIAALQANDTKYAPPAGKPALREAICGYLQRWTGVTYAPNQICATVGAKDACYLTFQALLNPGDEVLLPAPYWVSYPEQIQLAGGKLVVLKAADTGGKISAAQLRQAITPRTKLLVLNSPSNPSGAVYTRAELAEVAGVLKGTKIWVLSDEIYHRLVVEGEVSPSTAAVPGMYERTITVNGASKSFAMTGWRFGYAAGPVEVIDAINKLQSQITSGPTTFVQTASITAMTADLPEIAHMRDAYRRRGERMHAALTAISGVRCIRPQGAFYCFPDVSGTYGRLGVRDADEFASLVLERAHVAVVSGSAFGCPTHVRLSFATSEPLIDEGLRRLQGLMA